MFTGRRVDILDSGSLKIQYNRNRYYDYHTGRWLTQDPLGITPNPQRPNSFGVIGQYRDGSSLYEYAGSQPTGERDPWGLTFMDPDPHEGDEWHREALIRIFGGFREFEYGEGSGRRPFENFGRAIAAFISYISEKKTLWEEILNKPSEEGRWCNPCKKCCSNWSCTSGNTELEASWFARPRQRLVDVERNVSKDHEQESNWWIHTTRNLWWKHWNVTLEKERLRKYRLSAEVLCTRSCPRVLITRYGCWTEFSRGYSKKYWIVEEKKEEVIDKVYGSYWHLGDPASAPNP